MNESAKDLAVNALGELTVKPPRRYRIVSRVSPTHATVYGGSPLLDVASTQYLRLQDSLEWDAVCKSVARDDHAPGFGSHGSPYLGGRTALYESLVQRASDSLSTESAMFFTSGWMACYTAAYLLELCTSEVSKVGSIHHSMRSGLAAASRSRERIICTERLPRGQIASSIEGISGSIVDLERLWLTNAVTILDESHSIGVLADGTSFPIDIEPPLVRAFATSKALGVPGGIVAGDSRVIDAISQIASPWMFSAVPSLAQISLICYALEIARRRNDDRAHVLSLASIFRDRAREAGLISQGDAHISSIVVDPSKLGVDSVDSIEDGLAAGGILAYVSTFPTVPRDRPLIRVTFGPFHTESDVALTVKALAAVLNPSR